MAEPPVTVRAVHDSGAGNLPPTRVVIHATNSNVGFPRGTRAGQALATARYFQLASARGSAHYIMDVAGEEHCLPDNVIAWHAPPNSRSIGIEICAEGGNPSVAPKTYTRAQWLDPQVWPALKLAAERTWEICVRYGIPAVRLSPADLKAGKRGICGHVDVSQAFHQTDHSDPGPEFPWPEFMAAVTGGAAPAPAPAKTGDEHVADIQITVKPDGSFRRLITAAEAGSSSAVFSKGWVKFAAGWGTATFRVCQLRGGAIMPGGDRSFSPKVNEANSVPLLDGCEAVTLEGTATAGAELSAAVILVPR